MGSNQSIAKAFDKQELACYYKRERARCDKLNKAEEDNLREKLHINKD